MRAALCPLSQGIQQLRTEYAVTVEDLTETPNVCSQLPHLHRFVLGVSTPSSSSPVLSPVQLLVQLDHYGQTKWETQRC